MFEATFRIAVRLVTNGQGQATFQVTKQEAPLSKERQVLLYLFRPQWTSVLLAQDLLVKLTNAGLLQVVHKSNLWHRPF